MEQLCTPVTFNEAVASATTPATVKPSANGDFTDDPLIDRERSKGMPKGMFMGKDGVVYGFDEEANRRELDTLSKKIDSKKLRNLAKRMRPIRAKIEEANPDF